MKLPIPREHGAWGLLLQPFAAGAVLARSWTWLLAPALGLALLGFLLREPLIVVGRQVFVWRKWNPQSGIALRWAMAEAAGIAVCVALLLPHLPSAAFAALAAAAATLTGVAVWFAAANRRRSIALQILSAAGLGMTSLLAALASTGGIPAWGWKLWAVLTFHAAASILVVRARLDLRIALSRSQALSRPRAAAFAAQAAQLSLAGAALAFQPTLSIPLAFSSLANLAELLRLPSKRALQEPLTQVGIRTLAVSIAHTALTVAGLWN